MIEVALSNDVITTVVDDCDEWVIEHRWHLSTPGYAERNNSRPAIRNGEPRKIRLHRAILDVTEREIDVDHINHDQLDNRRLNLRIGNHMHNMQNRAKPVGVCWDRRRGKWRAYGSIAYKQTHIGYFSDREEAQRVANEWRVNNYEFFVA